MARPDGSRVIEFEDVKRGVLRLAAALLLLGILVYAGDYLLLRFKILAGRDPYGNVVVQPYYAIHQKNGKIEYQFAQPQNQICVNSLFPHFGVQPCWYVTRHTEKRIDI